MELWVVQEALDRPVLITMHADKRIVLQKCLKPFIFKPVKRVADLLFRRGIVLAHILGVLPDILTPQVLVAVAEGQLRKSEHQDAMVIQLFKDTVYTLRDSKLFVIVFGNNEPQADRTVVPVYLFRISIAGGLVDIRQGGVARIRNTDVEPAGA